MVFFAIFYDHYRNFVHWKELHSLRSFVSTVSACLLWYHVTFFVFCIYWYFLHVSMIKMENMLIDKNWTRFTRSWSIFLLAHCDIIMHFFHSEFDNIYFNFLWTKFKVCLWKRTWLTSFVHANFFFRSLFIKLCSILIFWIVWYFVQFIMTINENSFNEKNFIHCTRSLSLLRFLNMSLYCIFLSCIQFFEYRMFFAFC